MQKFLRFLKIQDRLWSRMTHLFIRIHISCKKFGKNILESHELKKELT
jgi:hypothetical protein